MFCVIVKTRHLLRSKSFVSDIQAFSECLQGLLERLLIWHFHPCIVVTASFQESTPFFLDLTHYFARNLGLLFLVSLEIFMRVPCDSCAELLVAGMRIRQPPASAEDIFLGNDVHSDPIWSAKLLGII
mmetsp:Transcript_124298/g.359460  ORF Transcript_124298/g.359460 Transcript_124298/m.359460 type:complete len:128 (-) Transcript_124298:81-464(-)